MSTTKRPQFIVALGLFGLFAQGCVVNTARTAYEDCAPGEVCASGTTCVTAMYSLTGRAGTFCSASCTSGPQCPVSPYTSTYLPTCVVSVSAGGGLCYDTCVSNVDCGGGTVCAQVPGSTVRICVPST